MREASEAQTWQRRTGGGAQCEEVKGCDVGTSTSLSEPPQPNFSPPTTAMWCSGGKNCSCTNFRLKNGSAKCRACSHPVDQHHDSDDNSAGDDSNSDSGSDEDGDGDDDEDGSGCGHGGNPLTSKKNEKTVSALLANLVESGEYTSMDVENAKKEAKAGLTKKHVSHFLGLRSVTRTQHTTM